jgi:hypothetical protein
MGHNANYVDIKNGTEIDIDIDTDTDTDIDIDKDIGIDNAMTMRL